MNSYISRRGSALLIVLGMLSFMIVSAVGFAVYMRSSRLPSSYLRRANSARLLAKAAIAEAVTEVDRAVANNFHPNVGYRYIDGAEEFPGNQGDTRVKNTWKHHVLMFTNETSEIMTKKSVDALKYETIPTLCMEALAYLPPSLINDVRFYSRITPTAKWHSFGFDAGRYSFVAVDVSDYLDINRLAANFSRASTPSRRISLAYVFEEADHTAPPSGLKAWDDFMNNYRTFDGFKLDFNKSPLVSLADFNLALGANGGTIGEMKSPFYEYVTQKRLKDPFEITDKDEILRNMTFITDGWFPVFDNGKTKKLPLYDDDNQPLVDNQPFDPEDLSKKGGSPRKVLESSDSEWAKYLTDLGCFALYDYLDVDHAPLSLALPTVERAPMICGIGFDFPDKVDIPLLKRKCDDENNPNPAVGASGFKIVSEEGNGRTVTMDVTYNINPDIEQQVFLGKTSDPLRALVVFPFNHKDEAEGGDGDFEIDGQFSLFLSSKQDVQLRTSKDGVLHINNAEIGNSGLNNGIVNIKLGNLPLTDKMDVFDDKAKNPIKYPLRGIKDAVKDNPFITVTYQWTQHVTASIGPMGVSENKYSPSLKEAIAKKSAEVVSATSSFVFLNENGESDGAFENGQNLAERIKNNGTAFLNVAVWLRVKNDSENKVVDMVPACLYDDKIQNGGVGRVQPVDQFEANAYPLMRFYTGVEINLANLDQAAEGARTIELGKEMKTVIVADPRFNYAPEHWYEVGVSGDALNLDEWNKHNHCKDAGLDGDMFMATSDAGYLQSIYELAMIPRFQKSLVKSNQNRGDYQIPSNEGKSKIATKFEDIANRDLMWSTYDPAGDNYDDFNDFPWTSEGLGFKVNPYSDSTNVLMAAFANTPIDWKRAAADYANKHKAYDGKDDATKFNKQYAFNEYSDDKDVVVSWRFLNDMAGRFRGLVREEAVENNNGWTNAWRRMGWEFDEDRFCGLDLTAYNPSGGAGKMKFSSVDRKFLYGYWRECFAARQQLFMVFVRAEPLMMGSGIAGKVPPQLGARAMALVWRDPTPTPKGDNGNYIPHRSRIIFYRQFD